MINIFLDESGIHKDRDHSVFVLVYVEVKDVEALNQKVIAIEQSLNISKFHWSEVSWPVKKSFIKQVLLLDFTVKLSVLNNPIHPEKDLERILIHMLVERDIFTLVIDGAKPKRYESRLKKILRDKGVSVRKIKMVDDEKSPGLRVADMVAGFVRAYYDRPRTELEELYNLLEKKIIIRIE